MKKKLISLIMAGSLLLSCPVYAETLSPGYDMFERLSSFGANMYIDDSITTDYIMVEAMKKVINDNPELATELIKAGFESLDEYTEFYTKEEYELFNKNRMARSTVRKEGASAKFALRRAKLTCSQLNYFVAKCALRHAICQYNLAVASATI